MATTFRTLLRTANSSKCTPFLAARSLINTSPSPVCAYRKEAPSKKISSRRFSSNIARDDSIEPNDTRASPQSNDPIHNQTTTSQSSLQTESDSIPVTNASPSESNQAESIPWYLQVSPPIPENTPLSSRQQIPDLPDSPPEILAPLLQQISVDLGMDDLSLLDLRHLDPPPALGANLLMIIGTARSEKHLHVSADRLCRWLRSNYKLRPDADGLLGRNELKLKLKRKARRSKLMGAKEGEGMDDGVRTGWVCVNVGTVGGSVSPALKAQREGFVGFGQDNDGVKIVVQLMVEEKRDEIDLERLWTGISKRQQLEEAELQALQHENSIGDGSLDPPLPEPTSRADFPLSPLTQSQPTPT